MRQQGHLATARQNVVHRGHDPLDPGGVGDATLLNRHVNVHAQQHAFAVQVHVVQRFPTHRFSPIQTLALCFAVIARDVNARLGNRGQAP